MASHILLSLCGWYKSDHSDRQSSSGQTTDRGSLIDHEVLDKETTCSLIFWTSYRAGTDDCAAPSTSCARSLVGSACATRKTHHTHFFHE